MVSKIGRNQAYVLSTFQAEGKDYTYSLGSGWIWGDNTTTARILDSLVRRGLLANEKVSGQGYSLEKWGRYTLTPEGRAYSVRGLLT